MRDFFLAVGLLMIVSGIFSGIYIGVWVCFSGIVDVITSIRAGVIVPLTIAIGIAKVLLSGFFGWLSALVLIIPGHAILQSA
jgi:uncharacterized membrane protein